MMNEHIIADSLQYVREHEKADVSLPHPLCLQTAHCQPGPSTASAAAVHTKWDDASLVEGGSRLWTEERDQRRNEKDDLQTQLVEADWMSLEHLQRSG